MFKLFIFVIVSLKLASAQSFITMFGAGADQDYVPAFKCLLSQKLLKGSLLQPLFIQEKQYWWQGAAPAEFYKDYPQQIHALLILDADDRDRSHFADLLANSLKDQPIKTVWIFVAAEFIKSCNELKESISVLSKILTRDQSFGIFTGPKFWSDAFYTEGCPQVPKIAPLFYYWYKDFMPFGGWTKAQYVFGKEIKIPQCGIEGSAALISYSERQ